MSKKDFSIYIEELLENIKNNDYVFSKDIPNIELYMDQVTTFMEKNLGLFKRLNDEKILTKTMINNYSKCDILPPTDKKKYSNEHLILLLFVYYLKQTLSIQDIKTLLDSLKNVLKKSPDMSINSFYDIIINTQLKYFDSFANQVNYTMDISKELFKDMDTDNKEILSIFTATYLLNIQASAYKYMSTQLIDNYLKREENKKETKKKRTK
jgi:hypothetical protein